MADRAMPPADPPAGVVPFVFEHRERAAFLVVAAALVLASHGVDVALHGGANWPALAVRLVWAALLLATAGEVRRGVRRPMQRMAALAAFGSAALFLALVPLTGHSSGPISAFTYVLVMTLPMVMPEALWLGASAALLLLGGSWLLLWRDGASAAELAGRGHVGLVALGIAWLLAQALRRARLAEVAAAAARQAAQAALAESELRAAEADKLAALGRMAGEIAHEINNPLSAARSTVIFLRDRLPPGDEEGRAASADLVAALDRIARSVWRLRHETRPATPADDPDEPSSAAPGPGGP